MMNKMCLFMMAGILLVAQSAVNAATDAAVTASLALSTNLMGNSHTFGADAKVALTSIATAKQIAQVTHNTAGTTVLASTTAVTNTRVVIAHHDQRVSA